jgi:transposase-like protein
LSSLNPSNPWCSLMISEAVSRDMVLECVRHMRFGGFSSRCLLCSHGKVVRWGSFSGRQRYRCQGCRRTYSDLTGTPLARTKRIERWPGALAELDATSTLRAGATAAGIHPSTGFRWRHKVLHVLSSREARPWASTAVLHRQALPFVGSLGSRSHGTISSRFYPPPRGHARKGQYWIVGVVGRDRSGKRPGLTFGSLGRDRRGWPTSPAGAPARYVGPNGSIWAREGFRGPTAVHARSEVLRHRRPEHGREAAFRTSWGAGSPRLGRDATAARLACHEFRAWLRGFRGISARYADHYLQWRLLGRLDLERPAGVHLGVHQIRFRKGVRLLALVLQVAPQGGSFHLPGRASLNPVGASAGPTHSADSRRGGEGRPS